MPSELASKLLTSLDKLAGGIHPGHRPVHARGTMLAGTFTPNPAAADLTSAPHAVCSSTPVIVRFSIASGIPTAAQNDPAIASPQGLAVRFQLGEHEHTDIIAHSVNGFPARSGDEFLAFLQAVMASGPGAPTPPPIVEFLATHPAARQYVEAPKPIPASYAQQAYFAVTAFKFTNSEGGSRFGRFRVIPGAGTSYLTPEEAASKTPDFLDTELSERLARGPVLFHIRLQLAEDGDDPTVSTVWPDTRSEVDFGTLTLTEPVDQLAQEYRKIIFDPVPRVAGIDSAGDPLTDIRSELYLMSGRRRRQAAAEQGSAAS